MVLIEVFNTIDSVQPPSKVSDSENISGEGVRINFFIGSIKRWSLTSTCPRRLIILWKRVKS